MARATADRSEGRWALLGLIAVAFGLLVLGRDAAIERRPGPTLTADIQAPVARWLGTPFRAAETTLATAEDRRRAMEENRALREELSRLRRDNQRLRAMQARLARIEATLDLRVDGEPPVPGVTARVVSDPGSPFVRSLLLSAGAEQGVGTGDAVLSDSGLVGHIVSRGKRSARVLRLDDLNSRVAVMNPDTQARAILVGANDAPPALRFVADPEGWPDGAPVVTSGDDGLLPQGLPIGTASRVGETDVRVRLHTTGQPLDWVLVFPVRAIADASDVELTDEALEDAEDATGSAPQAGSAPASVQPLQSRTEAG